MSNTSKYELLICPCKQKNDIECKNIYIDYIEKINLLMQKVYKNKSFQYCENKVRNLLNEDYCCIKCIKHIIEHTTRYL